MYSTEKPEHPSIREALVSDMAGGHAAPHMPNLLELYGTLALVPVRLVLSYLKR